MSSDEQLREQFEKWVGEHIKQWEAPGTTPAERQENVKHWLVMSDGEHFDHHATQGWWTGWQARGAEVQKLRELLAQVTEELAEEITGNYKSRYGDPIHPAMEGRYQRDMSTVHRARAALRAEGGDEQ